MNPIYAKDHLQAPQNGYWFDPLERHPMSSNNLQIPHSSGRVGSLNPGAKRLAAFLLWGILLGFSSSFLSAQGLPLTSEVTHSLRLSTGSSTLNDSFWVTESSSMLVRITLPQDNCQLALTSPSGSILAWDPASTATTCGEYPVQPDPSQPPVGYIYSFSLTSPVDGLWALQATLPTGAVADWNSVLDVEFASPIGIGLFPTSAKIPLGKSVSVSLGVMDGFSPLASYQCTARLHREGDPIAGAQLVSFSPILDPQTGQSTPVSVITPVLPGTYILSANVTGAAARGTYERCAATMFEVFPPPATISGTMTQRVQLVFPATPQP